MPRKSGSGILNMTILSEIDRKKNMWMVLKLSFSALTLEIEKESNFFLYFGEWIISIRAVIFE